MPAPTILFASSNENKIREVRQILGDIAEVKPCALDIAEIQGTIVEIAIDKCKRATKEAGQAILIEDTSLSCDALGGLPGPYIKHFLNAVGCDGISKMISTYQDKTAHAICTLAYSQGPEHEPVIFQGSIEGKLVDSRGSKAFGWDAIFEYDGNTFAEMNLSQKNECSHRSRALAKFRHWLATENRS